MEEKLQVRASLGSKLPKFGGTKPLGSFLQQAPNGTHSGLLAKASFSGKKHSDQEGTSAFSLNWRKLKCQNNDHSSREPPHPSTEKKCLQSQGAVEKDSPRLGIITKTGKQSNMLVSHKEDHNENLLSSSNKFTKSTQFGRTSYSGLNGCKTQVNGFYTNKPPTGLHRPRANSATSRNFTSKVLSTDNKPFSNVRRSQSFSHSVQNALLPPALLTRSHSFNRDVDVTRHYQLQHIRTTLKQNLLPRTAKQYGMHNGNDPHMKSSFTRTYSAGSSAVLQKHSLSNGPGVSVPLGYKMSRPSLNKSNRSQFPREFSNDTKKDSSVALKTGKMESLSNGTRQGTKEENMEAQEHLVVVDYSSCDNLIKENYKDSYCSEDVDELSISSLSSSEKNDFSEDFSDDFLELEDWNNTVIVAEPEKQLPEKPSDCSSDELKDQKETDIKNKDEWIGVNISVKNEAETNSSPYGENRISPDMEYREPSSLELSPSDSSDGTYMWDEEGMEPIGNVHPNVHPCGSYESSEMNSLDILNNLDSCDLEDDDLMLDVDLPEDITCDLGKGENMSHFERTERNLRQQPQVFWKRSPPRLNGQEQYHLSNPDHYHNGRGSTYLESPTDHRKNFVSSNFFPQSPRSIQMLGLKENTVMLDEMTLCHMVQDCTTVKTQLLKLKRLLQQEDDTEFPLPDIQRSVPATPEPQDTHTLWKTEDLLREIQQLKEESKEKDETIKQLEEQLKTRCNCQKESQESRTEKPKQYDKYTQTPWRSISSGYSPSFSPWQGPYQGGPWTGPPHRRQRVEELVHYFSDKACLKYYSVPSTPQVPQTTPREN
ncbi:serine-rich coiled-coil domain-containing protein 2 isoform X2 [Pseudophryne corroboree]|uniref:serine-rich coiled-coil domain-containing protein 2 isoform X2 n=1 Tax=Pseudophryne corroboree TaxID=495146 RepID=UPI0030813514